MANLRWTADKNIKFINEYQRNECLWDPKHPQYKNRNAREAAYKVMMEVMQMETVKDVVGKIRTLRNTYNNEILKVKKCCTTGMATDELYVSKIPWLTHMDFLKNIDGYTRENAENIPNNTQENSVSVSDIPNLTPSPISTRGKMKKMKDPLLKAVDALEKVSTQHFANTAKNDEFDLFGQTVAEQLRQLPLEIALETEEILLSTIRRQRIKVAKEKLTQRISLPIESISILNGQPITRRNETIDTEENDSLAYNLDEDVLQRAVQSIQETELNYIDY